MHVACIRYTVCSMLKRASIYHMQATMLPLFHSGNGTQQSLTESALHGSCSFLINQMAW